MKRFKEKEDQVIVAKYAMDLCAKIRVFPTCLGLPFHLRGIIKIAESECMMERTECITGYSQTA